MEIINYNHGKFFGPSAGFAGYVMIAGGLIGMTYSPLAMILFIPGTFMALTFTGTILDTSNRKVKPYTTLFGIFRTGKWIDINQFTKFNIIKVKGRYTSYSRANVRFDLGVSDIRLLLINKDGTRKVVINKYLKFEDAQKEMERLKSKCFPEILLSEKEL
jgi:hypothetical protein